MGKVVIGDNQNLLLDNGHVIKSKNLKEGDILFGFDYDTEKYVEAPITRIEETSDSLSLFSTSNGRIITCTNDTIFSGSLRKGIRSITTFNNEFDNYSWKNYVQSVGYLPVFGQEKLDDDTASLIKSSILYLNHKRPNDKPSLIQSIPKMLSKLTRNSLKKVLNDVNFIRNLDLYSKDLLIILLNKLNLNYNGKPHGRLSTEVSGTLKIKEKVCTTCVTKLKEEKLTCLGESNDKSLAIYSDSKVLVIGSILCRTN